jgi:hypothetical protein
MTTSSLRGGEADLPAQSRSGFASAEAGEAIQGQSELISLWKDLVEQ